MATFKQTLKHGLLRYPTIFPNPIEVCVHLFCIIGNGYEWYNGELVDKFNEDGFDNLTMKYSDSDLESVGREARSRRDSILGRTMPWFKKIWALVSSEGRYRRSMTARTGRNLQDKAKLVQMKFVADNIDAIVNANPTNSYFGDGRSSHYFVKGICVEYAHAFDFPDDIKKDWADALYTFLNHWLYALNCEYGPGREKDDSLSWWPKDVLEARIKILETRIRLHPYVYNGESYELHVARTKEMMNRILSKD